MSYLEIKNLEISFPTPKGKYIAVRDINLSIQKGEIISIIGHSGCGKSTIMNAIGGMLTPTGGTVELANEKIKGPGPDRGIVFQNYSLLPWLTVEENIFQAVDSVMSISKKEKHDIVMENLKMVNLFEHKDKLPGQLSGGMKQRVAIARAFAINPGVLLLDEPFGALDALTKGSMQLEVLKLWNLNNREKTIVMITHDIEEALFLSDRIVVLNNGPASTIREIVEVKLPRPRNKIEIVKTPEYIELRDHLLHLLTDKFSIEDMGMVYKS
ncbi:sulfate ABC transporter ATP-binding protein [Flavobacterium cheongpyeongense]|jgi:nitrate/nitrite transport system ATP-binding protein|uniref:Sulfate ABC transporter ATP-binding protein n=1 Tax=Flavobacterium cheongpyeongense TaxID=2212651 RepID=A0A2V4BR56_9FLAO|nr:ABC transporter ATP-binding protein [Flavobacterium cheongpyeongense]PXY41032.1 sulfate ABC transporter ATP-binding protein [Flavobacterium cheongpyeongense]